jgi:molybdopterin converting factor small subunit
VELTAEAIVELFRGDVRARKELAELLISEPDIRLAIINAVLRDVATKSDIEALRAAVKDDIEKLRESLENRSEQHRAATRSDIESLRKAVEERFERVATKSDIEALRSEFRRELDSVRREIDFLAREIDRLYRLVMVSVLGILISIATTILVRVLLPP